MRFEDAVKTVKDRLNLADMARRYLNLRQVGSRFVAPCPFHQETKPSFSINPDKGLFYCFGCQASGDLIDFYGQINGLDFKESVLALAQEAGITVEFGPPGDSRGVDQKKERGIKQVMAAMHTDAAAHFAGRLAHSSECLAYAQKRGLSQAIIEKFGLGWAERDWHSLENFLARRGYDLNLACEAGLLSKSERGNIFDRFRGRFMFPIRNLSNQVIAFGGRIIANEDEAKYINSQDTPIYSKKDHLYGLAHARRAITANGSALLTEGYMDVLTLHQFGFENSVGVLGTALTENQIKRLSGFTANIGLLFDGDGPGRKAALRACEMFLARGLTCSVILLPDGEDIDSLLRGPGPEIFKKLIATAPDGMSYCVDTLRDFAPREAISWAKNFLGQIQIPELASPYATTLAQKLGISEQEFRGSLTSAQAARNKKFFSASERRELCERDTQILLYAVRYPERLDDLRAIGADLAITSQRGADFWNLIDQYGPDEVVHHMDEKQKNFWLSQRKPDAPPRVNGDFELACLKRSLDRFFASRQAAGLAAAMGAGVSGENFDMDMQYLHAIRDAMRNGNEQS